MVHKKYIKRGNKVFGPYLYENYREKGITKTRYLGKSSDKKNKNPQNKNNLRVNKSLFIFFGIIILALLVMGLIISFNYSNEIFLITKKRGELSSQKSLQAQVNIYSNAPPKIYNLGSEILVCENTHLSNKSFIAQDDNNDALEFSIYPYPELFRLKPTFCQQGESQYGFPVEILSWWSLLKKDVKLKRIPGKAWAVYPETITVLDGSSVANAYTNITIIEVNNAPQMENIGVHTVWTHGEDSSFYYQVKVNDSEDGNSRDGNLIFNLTFLSGLNGREPFLGIDKYGVMNFSANDGMVGNYFIEVCAKDRGLINEIHPNISLCWNSGFYADPLEVCDGFSLTITNKNRPPNITSFYPYNLTFRAYGEANIYFNSTQRDPDGTVPDVYWYVDGNLKKYSENSSFDEFNYEFPCGIGGDHKVKVIATDGELNDSREWNISVTISYCNPSSPPSRSSPPGVYRPLNCTEDWVCSGWIDCRNFKEDYNPKTVSEYYFYLISERCKILNYDERFCGYQLRDCTDINSCGYNNTRPGTIRECYYTKNPSCNDGIKNCHNGSCEILTDCGGPCTPCPTCDDKIKNQGEEGIDCGGPCEKCEKPLAPNLYKSIISYSLILLLVAILILAIIQVVRYSIYKRKVSLKNLEKKFGNQISVILFFILIFILLFSANFFLNNFSNFQNIILTSSEQGLLGSYGPVNFFREGISKLFLGESQVFGNLGNINLGIWDETSKGFNRYTYCSEYCAQKSKTSSDWEVYFYANYTPDGVPVSPSDGNGNCYIKFDDSDWNNMNYNPGSFLWEYNRSFIYKHDNYYYINCTSNYENLSDWGNASIQNTAPYIIVNPGNYLPEILNCTEDSLCYYDFSKNVSEDDQNDVLTYGYLSRNTTLTNFTINSDTGLLTINITNSIYTGRKLIELFATDSDIATRSALLNVNIQEVNDPPFFINLENKTFNMSELFSYTVLVSDEENDIPYKINISFISCSTAPWSTRGSVNCTLFNNTQYSFDSTTGVLKIEFTPSKNDVGNYYINFSVSDTNPKLGDAVSSKIVYFSVLVTNEPPFFNYICDNERVTTEDSLFSCYINASDNEEMYNLTFKSDKKWFLDVKSSPCSPLTNYTASVKINFIPNDSEVGNWTINVGVSDTGNPVKSNSSIINFYVNNVNDPVLLENIEGGNFYIGNSYTIEINASDEDLRIPFSSDPSVYRESISFGIIGGSLIPWLNLRYGSVDKEKGIAYAYLDFSADSSNIGNHLVNITVWDSNHYSEDSKLFYINISGNNPPVWDNNFNYTINLYENNYTYIDISKYVSDADNDPISFSFVSGTSFPSFKLTNKGIIEFTPDDEDVGYHLVQITATDGKTPSPKNFTFTIYNINDLPVIINPLDAENMSNRYIYKNSVIKVLEDNFSAIFLFAVDNDYKIPENQKSFYREQLSVIPIIIGPNSSLLKFFMDNNYPIPGDNLTLFKSYFVPRKKDVGVYNILLNLSDKNNASDVFNFSLIVESVEHPPVLMEFLNYSAKVFTPFYLDINATDLEDEDDSSGNLTYSYYFLSDGGIDFINGDPKIFNTKTGVLNVTFNHPDRYHLRITVSDSNGLNDSKNFWIFVYDKPIITYPSFGCIFNLKENFTSELLFRANHSVGDNLTFNFYLDGDLRYYLSYYGDNRDLILNFTPNFLDETYGAEIIRNLTCEAYVPMFPELNASLSCDSTINHTNAPVYFNRWIGDKSTTYNNALLIDLKDYFYDPDNNDSHYNQSVDFKFLSYSNSSTILYRVTNDWKLILSSVSPTKELARVFATDYEYNVTSNNFTIEFTTPTTIEVPTPKEKSQDRIIALKIIVPGKISVYGYEKIIIPVSLFNNGQITFYDLTLNSSAYKDGNLSKEVNTTLDKTYFKSLVPGQIENLTLTLYFDTNKIGDYEILINANSLTPVYHDWAKIIINLRKMNESSLRDLIVFTEEFIVRNPQCIEIKEVINEARKLFDEKNFAAAKVKAEEAMSACEKSISQVALPKQQTIDFRTALYLILTIVVALILGLLYYFIKRKSLEKNKIEENVNEEKSSITAIKGGMGAE